jgi:hypothetical protein
MLITRKCPFTGKINEMDIPVTQKQLDDWHNGMMAQHAMPNLSADEREFIMTGITAEEWAKTFGESE